MFLPAQVTGLPRDSVVNVPAVGTVDKTDLIDRAVRYRWPCCARSIEAYGAFWISKAPLVEIFQHA